MSTTTRPLCERLRDSVDVSELAGKTLCFVRALPRAGACTGRSGRGEIGGVEDLVRAWSVRMTGGESNRY